MSHHDCLCHVQTKRAGQSVRFRSLIIFVIHCLDSIMHVPVIASSTIPCNFADPDGRFPQAARWPWKGHRKRRLVQLDHDRFRRLSTKLQNLQRKNDTHVSYKQVSNCNRLLCDFRLLACHHRAASRFRSVSKRSKSFSRATYFALRQLGHPGALPSGDSGTSHCV